MSSSCWFSSLSACRRPFSCSTSLLSRASLPAAPSSLPASHDCHCLHCFTYTVVPIHSYLYSFLLQSLLDVLLHLCTHAYFPASDACFCLHCFTYALMHRHLIELPLAVLPDLCTYAVTDEHWTMQDSVYTRTHSRHSCVISCFEQSAEQGFNPAAPANGLGC